MMIMTHRAGSEPRGAGCLMKGAPQATNPAIKVGKAKDGTHADFRNT